MSIKKTKTNQNLPIKKKPTYKYGNTYIFICMVAGRVVHTYGATQVATSYVTGRYVEVALAAPTSHKASTRQIQLAGAGVSLPYLISASVYVY
jgi:hypothetical protein